MIYFFKKSKNLNIIKIAKKKIIIDKYDKKYIINEKDLLRPIIFKILLIL